MQQYAWLSRKGIECEFCKRLKLDFADNMVYAQIRICLENAALEFRWDFVIRTDLLLLTRKQNLLLINEKKIVL